MFELFARKYRCLPALLLIPIVLPIAAAQDCTPVWTAIAGQPTASPVDWIGNLRTWDDGSGPALFVGGSRGLVRWNGTAWTTLLAPGGRAIRDLQVLTVAGQTALYIGVSGTSAGQGVHRWNGVAATRLGFGFDAFSIAHFSDAAGP